MTAVVDVQECVPGASPSGMVNGCAEVELASRKRRSAVTNDAKKRTSETAGIFEGELEGMLSARGRRCSSDACLQQARRSPENAGDLQRLENHDLQKFPAIAMDENRF